MIGGDVDPPPATKVFDVFKNGDAEEGSVEAK